ncbi:MAG: prolipoprotein diacylglyceryl transferase family protein, partial [Verrucomicrobiia bacterium]
MHPEFIRLGPLDIHTYGVFVAIGFILGLAVATRRARHEGIDPERITDLGAWLINAGMLGGKLFHI